MRTFIQLDNRNVVTSELQSTLPPIPPVDVTILEVTGRTDGPWLGKQYRTLTNDFIDYTPDSPKAGLPWIRIFTYDPNASPPVEKKLFTLGDPVGFDVEVVDDDGGRLTTFMIGETDLCNTFFPVPLMSYDLVRGTSQTVRTIGIALVNGFASRTITGFPTSGNFGADDSITAVARIAEPYIITIYE